MEERSKRSSQWGVEMKSMGLFKGAVVRRG